MAAETDTSVLRRVVVTGGCGFLGSYIVRNLVNDLQVEDIAIISRKPEAESLDPKVSCYPADITDEARIRSLFSELQPQAIIHTAVAPFGSKPADCQHITVDGTKVLLRCAAEATSVRAFVYTSSESTHEPHPDGPLAEEDAVVFDASSPITDHYGKAKAVADTAVLAANGKDLRTASIRLPVLYGEGCKQFTPKIVAQIRKNEHTMQVGDNKKVFEFCFGPKAAEAHVLAARALFRGDDGIAGEAFNISDGRPEPFFDFARRACEFAGHPVEPAKIKVVPYGVVHAMAVASEWTVSIFTLGYKQGPLSVKDIEFLDRGMNYSLEKAKNRLGYEPVADQDAALRSTMEWGIANCK